MVQHRHRKVIRLSKNSQKIQQLLTLTQAVEVLQLLLFLELCKSIQNRDQ